MKYSEKYDANYDELTNEWLEKKCSDPECEYCAGRPDRPLDKTEIDVLIEALGWARKNGLEHEFLEFFLSDYATTNDILSAIDHANREWDL